MDDLDEFIAEHIKTYGLRLAWAGRLEVSRYATVYESPVRLGGNWSAYVPDLPGCVSTGDTLEECRAMICEAIELHIAGLKCHGFDVPPPTSRVETLQVAA